MTETNLLDNKKEQGAFSILFSLLLGFGLIAVISILVLDGGNVAAERRVLQNVAESGAIALARECSINLSSCRTSQTPQNMALLNSPDGKTTITEICIKGTNQLLQPCQIPSTAKLDCAPIPAGTTNFVRVRTQTLTASGGALDSLFGNNSGYQLNGCAQAIWGNASTAQVFAPFAFSICQWALLGSGPQIIGEFLPNRGVTTCNYTFTDLQGQTFTRSGISGWAAIDLRSSSIPILNQASESCPDPATDAPANLRIGDVLNGITRDSSSTNFCDDSNLANKIGVWVNKTVFLPLVATQKLSGQATLHTIEAFSAFRFLGYSIKGVQGGTYPNGNWCSKNDNCIYGEFIATLSPGSDVNIQPGSPNIGLQAIRLT